MIVVVAIGDRKAQRHDVEERGVAGADAAAAEIRADVEAQQIGAGPKRLIGQQRLVGAPIAVGRCSLDELPVSARRQPMQLDDASGTSP